MSSSSAQSPGNRGADSSFTAPSGFLTQWGVRLAQHGLPLVNLCWLFPTTFFSFLCLERCSKKIHSMIFLRTDVRLTGLRSPGSPFWPFLKMGTMFAFLQLPGVSPDLHNFSNMIERPREDNTHLPWHPWVQPSGSHVWDVLSSKP